MKSLLSKFIVALAVLPTLALAVSMVSPSPVASANADTCTTSGKVTGIKQGNNCAKSADQQGNLQNLIVSVTNVLLFIIGAVAVIMIIIGGIKYVLSNGDSAQITSAKNTILYAVIGVIVALLAYAIVNFVVSSFVSTPEDGARSGGSGRTST